MVFGRWQNMVKRWIYYILIFSIYCFSFGVAVAQDPNTIKLKSFTPAPTNPAPTGTRPTGAGVNTPIPTDSTVDPSCTASNRGFASDCVSEGLAIQMSKPRYLVDTSLCTGGVMRPVYNSGFVPPDLVNLQETIGGEFWVWRDDQFYNKCKTDDLRQMLTAVENTYKNCVAFVAHGYRSYAQQQALWDSDPDDCYANPNSCGTAPAGKSLHQGGIGIDLYCMIKNNATGEWDMNNIPDSFTNKAKDFNFHRPLPGDPPHFNGI